MKCKEYHETPTVIKSVIESLSNLSGKFSLGRQWLKDKLVLKQYLIVKFNLFAIYCYC